MTLTHMHKTLAVADTKDTKDVLARLREIALAYSDAEDSAALAASFAKLLATATTSDGQAKCAVVFHEACRLCLPRTLDSMLCSLSKVTALTNGGKKPLPTVIEFQTSPVDAVLSSAGRPEHDADECLRALVSFGWKVDPQRPGLTGVQRYWADVESAFLPGYLGQFTARTPKETRPLRRLPYALIGQHKIVLALMEKLDYFALSRKDSKKPLVVIFSGASSHGKTELAREAARLCAGVSSLGEQNYVKISCGELTHETDLSFGAPTSYSGSEF